MSESETPEAQTQTSPPGISRRRFMKRVGAAAATVIAGAALPKESSARTIDEDEKSAETLPPLIPCEHPAGDENIAAREIKGLPEMTSKTLARHINGRFDRFAEDPKGTMDRDTMFSWLAKSAGDLTKRGLDDHFEHGGLGFERADFADIKIFERDILRGDIPLFQEGDEGEDGRHRALVICQANGKDADGNDLNGLGATVDRIVIDFMRLQGLDPLSEENSAQRQSLYDGVLSDLGVRSLSSTGVIGETGDFVVGETYMGGVDPDGVQHENMREVRFETGVENPGNGENEETASRKDSDNPLLVAAVVYEDENGEKHLRVEVFDGSNTPDPMNSQWDEEYGVRDTEGSNGRWVGINGGRFVPPGEGETDASGGGGGGGSEKGHDPNQERNWGDQTPDQDKHKLEIETGEELDPVKDPKGVGGK